jgi:hypothetical protein
MPPIRVTFKRFESMDSKGFWVIGAIALVAVLVLNSGNANADSADNSGVAAGNALDLSSLNDTENSDAVTAVQNLANVLAANNLTTLQQQLMLSQALFETGLFTDVPNTNAPYNLNNFSGISNSDGSLTSFDSIQDFVTDWIRILSKPPGQPINATGVTDFNNRLIQNGYYALQPANEAAYLAGLNTYFNMLQTA